MLLTNFMDQIIYANYLNLIINKMEDKGQELKAKEMKIDEKEVGLDLTGENAVELVLEDNPIAHVSVLETKLKDILFCFIILLLDKFFFFLLLFIFKLYCVIL